MSLKPPEIWPLPPVMGLSTVGAEMQRWSRKIGM
jgi:hypothetical protein